MQQSEDSWRHKGMRRKLIAVLRQKGIQDEAVLQAMERIPRHFFLDSAFDEWAYEDKAFPIAAAQTISQPFTVAYQTQMLQAGPGLKVLEIGTGSGYQSAVLAEMGVRVYTIERIEELFLSSRKILHRLGYKQVRQYLRDGMLGLQELAPFDRILVTCGANEIPQALKEQLQEGGLLVIPVGGEFQKMIRIQRVAEDRYREESFDEFKFVPLLEGVIKKGGK